MSGIYPDRLTTPADDAPGVAVDLGRLTDDLVELFNAEIEGRVTELALRDSVVERTRRIDDDDWWVIVVDLFPMDKTLEDLQVVLSWIEESPIWTETDDVAEAMSTSTPKEPRCG